MQSESKQNVDAAELAKFSEGDWWDEYSGAYALLHQLNPLRLDFVKNITSLEQKKVIDLGCGGGIFSEALAKSGAEVTGLDLNEVALEQARTHAAQENLTIDYQCHAIESFASQHPMEFDIVTCMEMLEHVPDPESIIAAASHLVKPGGYVFFSTINRNLRAFVEAIVGAEYIANLVPKGTHEYRKFIKPSELVKAARPQGLQLIDLQGLNYHPFKKTFSLSNEPKVNYLVAMKKSI